jgi:hypothetical protein
MSQRGDSDPRCDRFFEDAGADQAPFMKHFSRPTDVDGNNFHVHSTFV